jgi:hypothetical protein
MRLGALLIKKLGSRIHAYLSKKTSDFRVAGFGLLFTYEGWMSCVIASETSIVRAWLLIHP